MGFSVPEVLHEVQLNGGNGFNVAGMAFAGIPAVLIGHNEHVAWTSTTATGDNLDYYLEPLCDAGGGRDTGHVFNGTCRPFDTRVETINVRGAAPVSVTVLRSIHGPVVGKDGGVAVSQKRAHCRTRCSPRGTRAESSGTSPSSARFGSRRGATLWVRQIP